MKPVLSRDQIRALDRHAIDVCHVPSLVLMENAGRNAARAISKELAPDARVVVVAGSGNNGGDGLVVARQLLAAGAAVEVFLIGGHQKLAGDARANYDAWLGVGGRVLELPQAAAELAAALGHAAVVVDAIFGTGLDRRIEEPARSVIDAINRSSALRLSLDIPSGLHADSGEVLGVAVRATRTITFAHFKLGLLTSTGAEHAGQVEVVGIGVPDELAEQLGYAAEALESSDIARLLVPRPLTAHKGSAGRVVAFAGSPGKTGAALLVARGALRAGAGLVTIATFAEARAALDRRVLEEMTALLEPAQLEAQVDRLLGNASAVAIGPGLGHDADAQRLIDHVVLGWDGVKVVDADAISRFAGNAARLRNAEGRLILTPHPAELGRLLGKSAEQVERDRFGALAQAVDITGAVVVLKGPRSLIGAPGQRPVVNRSGSPALASGGSGDVLTGITAALCCQLEARDAACAAVHAHGLVAERWSRETGADRGLLAHEIADGLPPVLAALTRNHAALTV